VKTPSEDPQRLKPRGRCLDFTRVTARLKPCPDENRRLSHRLLRPGRRNSGKSQPQLHIRKEGDRCLRTLLIQGAHYILGPFGRDCDLRRWGLQLSERGGKNAKKRAITAVARKLAVLLHKLWVSGEAYDPLRNSRPVAAHAA